MIFFTYLLGQQVREEQVQLYLLLFFRAKKSFGSKKATRKWIFERSWWLMKA